MHVCRLLGRFRLDSGRQRMLVGDLVTFYAEIRRIAVVACELGQLEARDLSQVGKQRLEALGAKKIAFVRERWWVMEAPTGQRFCVVPMREDSRREPPNHWP